MNITLCNVSMCQPSAVSLRGVHWVSSIKINLHDLLDLMT